MDWKSSWKLIQNAFKKTVKQYILVKNLGAIYPAGVMSLICRKDDKNGRLGVDVDVQLHLFSMANHT